ncbi:Hypothetical predicted protein [Lynx pardinus]|uniref:Uncharacterized protein n=1 Tax=Lynx pardinus TaxID=191816 RepID=A0A485PSY9_LYNPA|nr:Hypothetical predicted protein [Lynx pardinus]
MAPTKKGGQMKGCSAISEVVTREYTTINSHKHIHGMGSKKRAPRALRDLKICHERKGNSRCAD